MPENERLNGDASRAVRDWLVACGEEARRITPAALYALGPEVQALYGPANAEDIETERGLIKYVLRFANGAGARSLEADQRRWQLRENFVYLHNAGGAAMLGNYAEHMLRDVWMLPVLRRDPHPHLSPMWVVSAPRAFDSLTAVMLLDPERPFGSALCQCQLPDCGNFFLPRELEGRGGRPNRLYCIDEHYEEAHKRASARRTRESRARRAAIQARKHK